MRESRNRLAYSIVLVVVVAIGLASRSETATALPAFLSAYAGDTLWALMVFILFGLLRPKASTASVTSCALGFAVAIELSQLCQADWLNALRGTWLGAKVLGFGFLWSDLACYAVGCGIGAAGEVLADRRLHLKAP